MDEMTNSKAIFKLFLLIMLIVTGVAASISYLQGNELNAIWYLLLTTWFKDSLNEK